MSRLLLEGGGPISLSERGGGGGCSSSVSHPASQLWLGLALAGGFLPTQLANHIQQAAASTGRGARRPKGVNSAGATVADVLMIVVVAVAAAAAVATFLVAETAAASVVVGIAAVVLAAVFVAAVAAAAANTGGWEYTQRVPPQGSPCTLLQRRTGNRVPWPAPVHSCPSHHTPYGPTSQLLAAHTSRGDHAQGAARLQERIGTMANTDGFFTEVLGQVSAELRRIMTSLRSSTVDTVSMATDQLFECTAVIEKLSSLSATSAQRMESIAQVRTPALIYWATSREMTGIVFDVWMWFEGTTSFLAFFWRKKCLLHRHQLLIPKVSSCNLTIAIEAFVCCKKPFYCKDFESRHRLSALRFPFEAQTPTSKRSDDPCSGLEHLVSTVATAFNQNLWKRKLGLSLETWNCRAPFSRKC